MPQINLSDEMVATSIEAVDEAIDSANDAAEDGVENDGAELDEYNEHAVERVARFYEAQEMLKELKVG